MSRFVVDILLVLFLFKQKTAYEMRISDWSSDVCSSDLRVGWDHRRLMEETADLVQAAMALSGRRTSVREISYRDLYRRSEERRVGKECVRTCRSRWWTDHYTKK